MKKISVVLVDDDDDYRWVMNHFLTRNGILVLETFSRNLFVQTTLGTIPDIAVISFDSNKILTEQSIEYLRKNYPAIKILINSISEHRKSINSIIEKNVEGLILKTHKDPEHILKALHDLHNNEKFFGEIK